MTHDGTVGLLLQVVISVVCGLLFITAENVQLMVVTIEK